MILYHGTTANKGEKILSDGCIKKDVERYYTKEKSGNGYSTQGYVYLSNEITFAIYFANCHNITDKEKEIYIFKINIPDSMVEPDIDEMRCQEATKELIQSYGGNLRCSLLEYKSCRVSFDIQFTEHPCCYYKVNTLEPPYVHDLIIGAGCNYKYVTQNYSAVQRKFLEDIKWIYLN